MKTILDIVHDENVEHSRIARYYGSYPSSKTQSGVLVKEQNIYSLDDLKKINKSNGSWVWAYSILYEDWFFGQVVGENAVAVKICSTRYKDMQKSDRMRQKEMSIAADGIFFSSRLSPDYQAKY